MSWNVLGRKAMAEGAEFRPPPDARQHKTRRRNAADNNRVETEKLFNLIVRAAKAGDLGLNGDKLVVTQFNSDSFGFKVDAQLVNGGCLMVKLPTGEE